MKLCNEPSYPSRSMPGVIAFISRNKLGRYMLTLGNLVQNKLLRIFCFVVLAISFFNIEVYASLKMFSLM